MVHFLFKCTFYVGIRFDDKKYHPYNANNNQIHMSIVSVSFVHYREVVYIRLIRQEFVVQKLHVQSFAWTQPVIDTNVSRVT